MTQNTETRDQALIEPMYDVAQEAWASEAHYGNDVFARATKTSGTLYRFRSYQNPGDLWSHTTSEHEFYFAPFAVLKDIAMLSQYAEYADIVTTLTGKEC